MSDVPQPFQVDRRRRVPLFRQVYDRARAAIVEGGLRPGERLPSARSLAAQLGSARGTIDAAYAMLAGEGWVVARGAAGTVVAPLPGSRPWTPALPVMPPGGAGAEIPGAMAAPPPFRMGLPALDAFPRQLWARLVAREARALAESALGYPDPAGDPALRRAIAAYLAIARGITCRPEQILVTAGYQGALSLVARMLLAPGEAVWVEDPGYHMT